MRIQGTNDDGIRALVIRHSKKMKPPYTHLMSFDDYEHAGDILGISNYKLKVFGNLGDEIWR